MGSPDPGGCATLSPIATLTPITTLTRGLLARWPGLGYAKAGLLAVRDCLVPPASASQEGEDRLLLALLEGTDMRRCCFVDVGANAPTRLSNTFLLQRLGMDGVLIEPDPWLAVLQRCFRGAGAPRCLRGEGSAVVLTCACSVEAGVLPLQLDKAHVFHRLAAGPSAAADEGLAPRFARRGVEAVPVIRLDDLLPVLPAAQVGVLSVDVEGHELEVLRGGTALLERTAAICVEHTAATRVPLTRFLADHGFSPAGATSFNLLFRRVHPSLASEAGGA